MEKQLYPKGTIMTPMSPNLDAFIKMEDNGCSWWRQLTGTYLVEKKEEIVELIPLTPIEVEIDNMHVESELPEEKMDLSKFKKRKTMVKTYNFHPVTELPLEKRYGWKCDDEQIEKRYRNYYNFILP